MERRIPIRRLSRDQPAERDAAGTKIWSNPPLLSSERLAEFQALHAAMVREIDPRGVIEELYVHDISWFVWEIVRLRRCRINIIKANHLGGLRHLLSDMINEPGQFAGAAEQTAEELSLKWFASKRGKEEVRRTLKAYDLDDSAIEAAAIHQCLHELEALDRLMSNLEIRRDRALESIASYRLSFARKLREAGDNIINDDRPNLRRLKDSSVVTSPE